MLRTYSNLHKIFEYMQHTPMSRPSGQFIKSQFKLLSLIKRLAGLGACFATTKFLAKQINKCERQTKRYLSSLEEKGIIKSYTSKLLVDPLTGKRYRRRLIRINRHFAKQVVAPKIKISKEWDDIVKQDVDKELSVVMDEMTRDQERILLERLLSEENDPYKQFDMEAVAKELQAELAEQGIVWEI